LQAFFSVRSERQLTEQLDYNLMYRWFVGLGIDDPVWDATVFTKNRDRLLDAEVAAKFMAAVLAHREVEPLLSSDHRSMARWWRRGPRSIASAPRTARTSRRLRAATASAISTARSARTTRTRARPTDAKLYRKSSNTAANPSARRQCPLKKRIKENRSQPRFYASSSGCLKIPGSSRSPLELSGLACR